MKIGFLHLSDIHIKTNSDPILEKASSIAAATSSLWCDCDKFAVIVTGDIAFSGSKQQYEWAEIFFKELKTELEHRLKTKPIHFIIIPGNHDCDFSGKQDLRDAALNQNSKSYNEDGVEISPSDQLVQHIIEGQKNFFDFCRHLEPTLSYPSQPEVFYQLDITLGEKKVVFNCINTAWCSVIHESPAKMYYPENWLKNIQHLRKDEETAPALTFSLFHHPDNWRTPSNRRAFRKVVDGASDVLMSGHEHVGDIYTQIREHENNFHVFEADVLQEEHPEKSFISRYEFIEIDFEVEKFKVTKFHWNSDNAKYRMIGKGLEFDFYRNRKLLNSAFRLNKDFENKLLDLGLALQHNYHRQPLLPDLFCYPRMQMISIKEMLKRHGNATLVDDSQLPKILFDKKRAFIFGGTLAGKSTFAKALYLDSIDKGLVPVMADGNQFNKITTEGFEKVIESSFKQQYEVSESWEDYKALVPEQRILIIDDFQKFKFNHQAVSQLLEIIEKFFDFTFIFAHSDYQIQQLSNDKTAVASAIGSYQFYSIKEFNKSQRTKILRKWNVLGREYQTSTEQLLLEENRLAQVVDTAILCGLPASPIFILNTAQLNEGIQPGADTHLGSYGYLFQSIITSRLNTIGKKPEDIAKYTKLLELTAYQLFITDEYKFTEQQLIEVIADYQRDYDLPVDVGQLLSDLTEARIWVAGDDSGKYIKFAHPYLRYYFAAQHLTGLLNDEDNSIKMAAESRVADMMNHITYDPYSRVLLFLVFHANTKQQFIKNIVEQSRSIYPEFEPTDLEKDVEFLNKPQNQKRRLVVSSGTVQENIDRYNQQLDENDENKSGGEIEEFLSEKNTSKYSAELDSIRKVAIALRMIELLGQVLLSFHPTLKKELKEEIVTETINLGLRMLKSFLTEAQLNWEAWKTIFIRIFQENSEMERHSEIKGILMMSNNQIDDNSVNRILIWLCRNMSYGVLMKIARSIGNEDIKNTFNKLASQKNTVSYQLADQAIRLHSFSDPRFDKVKELSRQLSGNDFAWDILRSLIVNRLYLFSVSERETQELCSEFDISFKRNKQQFLQNSDKKLLPKSTSSSNKSSKKN